MQCVQRCVSSVSVCSGPPLWRCALTRSPAEPKAIGANLYMFLSNEADIIREVRAFAATLP
jgi:hypothetical protein